MVIKLGLNNNEVSELENLKDRVYSLAKSILPYIELDNMEDTDKLRKMFLNCFVNTADTTVEYIKMMRFL